MTGGDIAEVQGARISTDQYQYLSLINKASTGTYEVYSELELAYRMHWHLAMRKTGAPAPKLLLPPRPVLYM